MRITRRSNRYQSRRDPQTELRIRLRDLAVTRHDRKGPQEIILLFKLVPSISEEQLERYLNQTRRASANYMAKIRVGNVAVDRTGAKKLRMIESVERFEPELQRG